MKELEKIKSKYQGCNFIHPRFSEMGLPDDCELIYTMIKATKEDFYKVPYSVDDEVIKYGLRKKFLLSIALNSGVMIGIDSISGNFLDKERYVYQAKAGGTLNSPDGNTLFFADSKTIDLNLMIDKKRKLINKYIENGFPESPRTFEIESQYRGEWKKSYFFLEESEKERYTSNTISTFILKKRDKLASVAQTLAMMKMIKGILVLEETYTEQQINEPFVIVRMIKKPNSVITDEISIKRLEENSKNF
ncbi:MAG: hypothetical protein ACRCU3_01845 [Eubacteriaceae bacterium]